MRGRSFFSTFPHEETSFAVIRNHPPAQSAAQQTEKRRWGARRPDAPNSPPDTRSPPSVPDSGHGKSIGRQVGDYAKRGRRLGLSCVWVSCASAALGPTRGPRRPPGTPTELAPALTHRTGVGQASGIRRLTSRRCTTLYGTIRKGGGGAPHRRVAVRAREEFVGHARGGALRRLPCPPSVLSSGRSTRVTISPAAGHGEGLRGGACLSDRALAVVL